MPTIAPAKIGIIYPPPEVRTIVDKTAAFVARNGPEFQEKIRQNEINNPKFNFLNDNDPYHAYYKHKVKENEENKGGTSSVDATISQQQQQMPQIQKLSLTGAKTQEQQKIIQQMFIPKEPPQDFEFIIDAPSISPLDIDVMKLTAQFVSRNGRPFLTSLMNKEHRNALFDFLKPQHSHFSYFTRLVEHYTKILLPTKDLPEKLKKEGESVFYIYKEVQYRSEWQKFQLREKAREDELIEKERVAYAQIDWHDFVVVETVDYQPNELGNFPPPTTPQDVGARVVAQERLELTGSNMGMDSATMIERIIEDETRIEDDFNRLYGPTRQINEISLAPPVEDHRDKNIDEVAMDEDSGDEEARPVSVSQMKRPVSNMNAPAPGNLPMPRSDLPLPPNPEKVIIRKDYDPRAKFHKIAGEEYFTSPITGERIPASSIPEHMRISLLDPKWLDQKEKEKKEREKKEREELRLKREEEARKKKADEEERRQQRLKREEESRKRRAEEEERKQENRKKLEELRLKREEERVKKEEERLKREEERIKREEEKLSQTQERLEKERQRQELLNAKNEEKRKRDEEKLKEEEEKRRKADLAKNQFAKFFIKIDTPKTNENADQKMYRFMSFQLKENMSLAPVTRREDIMNMLDRSEFIHNLDKILTESNQETPNYLEEMRKNPSQIRKQKTSCRKSSNLNKINNPLNNIEEESLMSIEEIKNDQELEAKALSNQKSIRVKYLHFDKKEYRRPPYYGTWRKKSSKIKPRKPFAKDEKLIDYEVDSDDEWEDIADGESIADSDKGDEEEDKPAEDEEDDGFFVPHGHLSDDELDEDERLMDPEAKKAREAAKTEQWETERKKSSKYLIPKCFFAAEYWNPPQTSESMHNTKYINQFERLKMVPFLKDFSVSLFPIKIQTDQAIAKLNEEQSVKPSKKR